MRNLINGRVRGVDCLRHSVPVQARAKNLRFISFALSENVLEERSLRLKINKARVGEVVLLTREELNLVAKGGLS